jgi:hypothetical protein
VLRTLLIWGLLAGLCGGVAAAGFAKVAGEPPLDRAIAWEEAHSAPAAGGHDHGGLVSRQVQSTVGLLLGAMLFGIALGGLFALVFAAVYGRVSTRAGPARTAIALGLVAFVVLYLVPFVKYPANPPSVGNPDTIGDRTALYLGMIAISVLAAIAALRLRRDLVARAGEGMATLLAVAGYFVVVVVAGLVMPGVHEVPATFPATVLFDFREASVGTQLVLWTTIALAFGAAAERVVARTRAGARAPSAQGLRLPG